MGGGTGREGGVDREDGATRRRGRWSGKCDTTLFVKLQYHSAQLFSQFQVDYQSDIRGGPQCDNASNYSAVPICRATACR